MAMSAVYTNFGGILVCEERNGVERQYVSDTLGSLNGELDENENLTYTAEYWPYGELRTSTGTRRSCWGFVGLLGYFADLASLLYVRARHCLTQTARWLTVDPLWPNEDSYQYAYDSPIDFVDESGEGPTKRKTASGGCGPDYDPRIYNASGVILRNNCFAYACSMLNMQTSSDPDRIRSQMGAWPDPGGPGCWVPPFS